MSRADPEGDQDESQHGRLGSGCTPFGRFQFSLNEQGADGPRDQA
ncbi:MAG: hypothetical protein ACI89E_000456 [Planctomycetota bacterium]|jgi:hypothetical protein